MFLAAVIILLTLTLLGCVSSGLFDDQIPVRLREFYNSVSEEDCPVRNVFDKAELIDELYDINFVGGCKQFSFEIEPVWEVTFLQKYLRDIDVVVTCGTAQPDYFPIAFTGTAGDFVTRPDIAENVLTTQAKCANFQAMCQIFPG